MSTGVIRRVSVGPGGRQGDGDSGEISAAAISGDGRFVTFTSDASNLVAGDTNGTWDVFVRDLRAGVTRRVSVGSQGQQANDRSGSWPTALSYHGRFVAFDSTASNLVSGDTNAVSDVFVRDLVNNTTRRVSKSSAGGQGDLGSDSPTMSADGWTVGFASYATDLVSTDTNDRRDVFVRDRRARTTRRVSVSSSGVQADNASLTPAISPDGQHVAFSSDASNLVGGDTNAATDVFVRDSLAD